MKRFRTRLYKKWLFADLIPMVAACAIFFWCVCFFVLQIDVVAGSDPDTAPVVQRSSQQLPDATIPRVVGYHHAIRTVMEELER